MFMALAPNILPNMISIHHNPNDVYLIIQIKYIISAKHTLWNITDQAKIVKKVSFQDIFVVNCCKTEPYIQHIEAETKWMTFFPMIYSNELSCMEIYEFRLKFHWPGNRSLTLPMVIRLLTHICATGSQWFNNFDLTVLKSWLYQRIKIKADLLHQLLIE